MSDTTVRIGLIFDYSQGYCRGVLRGVRAYGEARPHWFFTNVPPDARAVEGLRALGPAGVIAQVFSEDLADALLALGGPLVNVSAVLADLPVPRVGIDNPAVGRLAAEHLLGRGLRHFGFLGHAGHAYSKERENGFRQRVEAAGFSLACHQGRAPLPWDSRDQLLPLDRAVGQWLILLPKPVGVLAPNDMWAYQLLEVCRQEGLRVPDDLAVVGVDNDDLLCGLARPPLTSVATPTERVGYEAAALLDRLMAGPGPADGPPPLAPLGVVARQSTDVLMVDDPAVAAAVRFIRERACTPIGVGDLLRAVQLPRRTLERRFRAALGRGPGEEIRHTRVERACYLLAASGSPMAEVARAAGFTDAKHFCVAFRHQTGQSPGSYRRKFRRRSAT